MIGSAFEACRKMQYLPSSTGELAPPGSLTQLVCYIPVMLGAGRSCHHACQNAPAHSSTPAAISAHMLPALISAIRQA